MMRHDARRTDGDSCNSSRDCNVIMAHRHRHRHRGFAAVLLFGLQAALFSVSFAAGGTCSHDNSINNNNNNISSSGSVSSACRYLVHLGEYPPAVNSTNNKYTTRTRTVFDGIGAISGGGGETVLLPWYPPAQQTAVLDLLLKPSYGAALHILKVEVGGDALSTDGAEPSHMHTEDGPDEPNFSRGYEWWMAKEAKKRNPNIKLYGLPWEFPAWIGEGTMDPYHNVSKTLHYMMEWLRGGRDVHGLSFDYMGIWNERECNSDYVVAFRKAMDASGFNQTKIIAPDAAIPEATKLIQSMLYDPEVANAVHAVGYHYPNSNPQPPAGTGALGKALWASEDDSTVSPPTTIPLQTPHPRKQPGGGCLVRTINQNWVQGNITATIVWNLVMARYPQMRWDYTGLMAATDPFNGHFDVLPPVWAVAHTTQFTQPGWTLLNVGSGSGWLDKGGTYVSYRGPPSLQSPWGDLTIVIEKMDANESKCERGERPSDQIQVAKTENVTFVLDDFYPERKQRPHTMVLWASHFGGTETSKGLFTRLPDVPIVENADGSFTVSIEVQTNWAYTISTVRTASKGGPNPSLPPSAGKFPLTYEDNFDTCGLNSLPQYVAPLAGAFECVAAAGGRTGRALQQMSPAKAICDRGDVTPFAIIGDAFRTIYNVSVDVLLPSAPELSDGGAFVGARTKGPVGSGTAMDGIFFAVNTTKWHVALSIGNVSGSMGDKGVIASGAMPATAFPWRRISLAVSGTTAFAAVDGVIVASALKIPAPYNHFTAKVAGEVVDLGKGGYASFGTIGYNAKVQFDKLRVTSSDNSHEK